MAWAKISGGVCARPQFDFILVHLFELNVSVSVSGGALDLQGDNDDPS